VKGKLMTINSKNDLTVEKVVISGLSQGHEVICEVTASIDGKSQTLAHEVTLTPYTCKGDYIFPIKGPAAISGTPFNRVMGHRLATSQEFAFDVIYLRRSAMGGFTPSEPPNAPHVRRGDGILVRAMRCSMPIIFTSAAGIERR
jgi:hypothetical protein